ncbi:MAG: DHH family phosphoesterase [Desulfuromonadaceae bacterium]|nr:DHH family phosphoesterase [Desulfuromonadaceae bacterium]
MNLERSRRISDQILERVQGHRRILIVTHDNPDPDALASASALAHLLLMKNGYAPVIASGGLVGRRENRTMVEELEIELIPLAQIDFHSFDLICMVDGQPGLGNSSVPASVAVDVVIDHHPIHCEAIPQMVFDVRPEYGACATILYEYLLAQQIYLNTRLATALFYAVRSETQDLGRDWVSPDRKAYQDLLALSNNRILFDISHAKVPRSYFRYFNKALESARIFCDMLVFNLYEVEHPDIVAEMADFLLRMDEVNLVLGMGHWREEEVLSLRTDREELKAGKIIRELVAGLGTAGGHGMMAGGQIRPLVGNQAVQRELENTLIQRLLELRDYEPVRGQRLL